MKTYELIAPCHPGLEVVLRKETLDLGYEISLMEDDCITFTSDGEAICHANILLRTAECVLLKTRSSRAGTFEELFQGTKAIAWEEYVPGDGKFWVTKASSVKNRLFSPFNIRSTMKKAMAERVKKRYNVLWFPKNGASYPLHVFLYKDVVTVGVGTSGDSLHRRGYRILTSEAPITETLTAALIMLTPWNKEHILVDPSCESGTFPTRAAMMAANMASGMNCSFLSENWKDLIKRKCWYEAVDEANELMDRDVKADTQGYDIDGDIVKAARTNAESAGVNHMIHFQQRPVSALSHPKKYGFIISGPLHSERPEKKSNPPASYREAGECYVALDAWSIYLITSYKDAEQYTRRKTDKNREIYNSVVRTYFYQFMGLKPPRRNQESKGN